MLWYRLPALAELRRLRFDSNLVHAGRLAPAVKHSDNDGSDTDKLVEMADGPHLEGGRSSYDLRANSFGTGQLFAYGISFAFSMRPYLIVYPSTSSALPSLNVRWVSAQPAWAHCLLALVARPLCRS